MAKGIVEKSLAEERLEEIGISWNARAIEVDEYIAEIVKYKKAEEQRHPGKPWGGHVPQSYSVTLEDGSTARVGGWVSSRKTARRKRLEKGIEEKSLAEKRLDEIGLSWEAFSKRTTGRDAYMAEKVECKETEETEETEEQKHPWDGHVLNVPASYQSKRTMEVDEYIAEIMKYKETHAAEITFMAPYCATTIDL